MMLGLGSLALCVCGLFGPVGVRYNLSIYGFRSSLCSSAVMMMMMIPLAPVGTLLIDVCSQGSQLEMSIGIELYHVVLLTRYSLTWLFRRCKTTPLFLT